jgi:hypothetical protein
VSIAPASEQLLSIRKSADRPYSGTRVLMLPLCINRVINYWKRIFCYFESLMSITKPSCQQYSPYLWLILPDKFIRQSRTFVLCLTLCGRKK